MAEIANAPTVKMALVGASRPYFSLSLVERRLNALIDAFSRERIHVHKCSQIIRTDADALAALKELSEKQCNAAVVYLGNFGPEGPVSLFVQRFPGPVMLCGAAEEDKKALATDRGDALCGLLNCSYNLALRRTRAYIPQRPIALPDELAAEVDFFARVARTVIGVRNLKLLAFGPRPQDFFACHAPLQPLIDLGVEVMENSELDLFQAYKKAAGLNKQVAEREAMMKQELGEPSPDPDLLRRMAQFEVALMEIMDQNVAEGQFPVFANKCWPAFQAEFGFLPCYVNGRMAGLGVPVACEVDMYGAVSQYMLQLASLRPAGLLDINNNVPSDVLPKGADLDGAKEHDLFMGFHCGNAHSACMSTFRLTPPGKLEGSLIPGPITLFRLHATPQNEVTSYVAQGRVLDVDPCTFGSVAVIAIPGFARFYREVLLRKPFPHHAGAAYDNVGAVIFEALQLLGVDDISFPLEPQLRYENENPFAGSAKEPEA